LALRARRDNRASSGAELRPISWVFVISDGASPDCLSGDEIARFLDCRLTAEESARARAHLVTGCAACQRALVDASRNVPEGCGPPVTRHPAEASPRGPLRSAPTLPAGTEVGRYRIVRLIGGGGGGQVYEAADPQLGRAVALKLTRVPMAEGPEVVGEARALARLSHPNVVEVHDAGIWEERAFVVMALVEGISLARWLEEAPRGWREVVARFIEAARGLAAAHAAGLVHRDFKPDNVIVGADGRTRVADFGLAHPSGHAPAAAAGRVAGTPAYMAPEQFVGEAADARTDQFSFCVAFYWALYGQHPFHEESLPGATVLSMAREVIAGRPRRPPPRSRVPRWLERLLHRGLNPDPPARFASMDALLEELERGLGNPDEERRRLRRRLAAGAAGVLALAGVGLALVPARWFGRAAAAGVCGDGQVQAPMEECDDGNRADGDSCSSRCLRCDAGDDRFVWAQSGRCYSRHDQPLSWHEAAAACREVGAHLVSLNAYAELRKVHTRMLAGRTGAYWIGLSDSWGSGEYRWSSGEPQNLLLRWSAQPPPPSRCVSLDAAGDVTVPLKPYRAEPCGEARGFLCEKEEWRTSPMNGHAYRHLGLVRTVKEAMGACERAGGHLVTIDGDDENLFVGSQFMGTLWLGAIKHRKAGYFEWITGEPFAFESFAPGDPDLNLIPDCLVLGDDRKWYDRPCDGSRGGPYGVVCEID
jgi:cysteine-rich repeat protein